MNLKDIKLDYSWSLFLDRDGVINHRIPDDYVRNSEQFRLIDGAFDSIIKLNKYFKRILIVTNQQGIGKGLMSHQEVTAIHNQFLLEIESAGGDIDNIYYSPHLEEENSPKRKPNIGMAIAAKNDFPDIDFEKSIMIGDSISDLKFGRNAGMKTVLIKGKEVNVPKELYDFCFDSLMDFTADLCDIGLSI